MSKQKVLLLGPDSPDAHNSGFGVAVSQIIRHLNAHEGIELVTIDALSEPEEVQEQRITSNISRFENSIVSDIISTQITSSISPYLYNTVETSNKSHSEQKSTLRKRLEEYSEEIISVAPESQVDVVYAHDWVNFQSAAKLADKYKAKLVLHVHSTEYDRNPVYQRSWIFDLEKESFNRADKIICVSDYSKSILVNEYEVKANKIDVVYNGLSPLPEKTKSNPFSERIVLFVGRLTNSKAPLNFLEVAKKVNSKNPNTRFVIVGQGDLYDDVVKKAADLGLVGKVHLTGFIDREELSEIYSMSDVYCMPSLSEPFGLTAIEAASKNLPLVISANSGAAEVLPNAAIVDPQDLDAFADEVDKLLKNQLGHKQLEENKEAALGLNWDNSVKQIVKILKG